MSRDGSALVTIITTFRDAAAFLAESIASVRAQTEPRFVHRLFDDGSTDASLSIALAAAATDARLEVVALPHVGRRAALEAAHRNVTTPFVAWVDADDGLEPEALARTLDVMAARPACGLVFTDHTRIDADGRRVRAKPRAPFSRNGMLVDFATFHFRLIRRDAFERAGGIDPDLEVGIDYDLCLRLSDVAAVAHLAEPLYRYREHAGQMSATRRREQARSSATAVRRTIGRRGLGEVLALRVDPRNGRFHLRTRNRSKPQRWHEHARMAARALLGRRGVARSHPRTVSVWPLQRGDVIAAGIVDGFHLRSLGLLRVAPTLPALLRAAWSGRVGDVLVLHGIAAALTERAPGPRAAQRRLLAAALDRVRAQGARLVWCTWVDARDARLDRDTIAAVQHRCDVLVVGADEASHDVPTIVTPPGHVLELHPIVSRVAARERLGLPLDEAVFVRPGRIDDLSRAIEIVRATPADAQLVVRAPPPRDDVARALGAGAIDASRVHWLLHPLDARSLATAVAAADAVVLEDGVDAWALALVTAARGRALVVPQSFTDAPSSHRYGTPQHLARILAELASDRSVAAEAGRVVHAHTRAVAPDRVAELILAALCDNN